MGILDWLKGQAAENIGIDDESTPRENAEKAVEPDNARRMLERIDGKRQVTEQPPRRREPKE